MGTMASEARTSFNKWEGRGAVGSCKGCEDRRENCHATCERYLNAKRQRDETKKEMQRKQLGESTMRAYIKERNRRKR